MLELSEKKNVVNFAKCNFIKLTVIIKANQCVSQGRPRQSFMHCGVVSVFHTLHLSWVLPFGRLVSSLSQYDEAGGLY